MKRSTGLLFVGVAAVVVALSGCAASAEGEPVIAPVTMSAGDLQGATVDLKVGQVLNITTGDLDGESYTGTVEDPSVAEFVPATKSDTAEFNPGVKAIAQGDTKVVLSNSDGGIQDVTFTVEVTAD